MIKTILNFRILDVFFTKEDVDYNNKHFQVGFRYTTGKKNFTDIYLFPKFGRFHTNWNWK